MEFFIFVPVPKSWECYFSFPFPKVGNGLSHSRSQKSKSHSRSPLLWGPSKPHSCLKHHFRQRRCERTFGLGPTLAACLHLLRHVLRSRGLFPKQHLHLCPLRAPQDVPHGCQQAQHPLLCSVRHRPAEWHLHLETGEPDKDHHLEHLRLHHRLPPPDHAGAVLQHRPLHRRHSHGLRHLVSGQSNLNLYGQNSSHKIKFAYGYIDIDEGR